MFDQNLPTYIHTFETYPRWKTFQSEHYIFHYFAESEAEKDLEHIVKTQESAYQKIITTLKLDNPGKLIEYYFYPNEATKTALMGDDWYAQAILNEFRVHVLYTKKDKPLGEHEDTHLLSLPWGLSFGLFNEGLAESMVGHAWDGTPHLAYVKEGYAKGMYPALSELMDHQGWLNSPEDGRVMYWYSLVGAFTAFLIQQFGIECFGKLYRNTRRENTKEQNSTVFQSVYGKTISEVEEVFKNFR